MTQRKRCNHPDRARLPQWQAALLLCLFIAVRGLVPVGFMPAPLAAGTPYTLCYGDSRSALLLSALTQWQQGHHRHGGGHHDALAAQTFADSHCSFSAGAALTGALAVDTRFTVGTLEATPLALTSALSRRVYVLPPTRAPPALPHT